MCMTNKKGIFLHMVLGGIRYRGIFCGLFLHIPVKIRKRLIKQFNNADIV